MSRKASEIDPKSAETITFGGFVFLTKSKELQTVEGEAVDLRSQSAEVLSILAARPGEIVSKDALMVPKRMGLWKPSPRKATV
jgi:DNA-binding winged helix-turn-helix (wHTH) protein